MCEVSKKEKRRNLFFEIVFLFTLGCFLGWLYETILCYIQRGYIESRSGLVYGPFNTVYGFGTLLIVFALKKCKNGISIFAIGALLGGVFEYLCSWIQEIIFGTISWNYSKNFLNLGGRTSPFHMVCWGLCTLVLMKAIYPYFKRAIHHIKESHRFTCSCILAAFFIMNMFISSIACLRQEARINGQEPENRIDIFLDKHFPDSRLNKIFPNRRDAKTKEKIK